jgi:hypothetical protein
MVINPRTPFWVRLSQVTKIVKDVNADVRAGVVVGTGFGRKIENLITGTLGKARGTKCSQGGWTTNCAKKISSSISVSLAKLRSRRS